MSFDARTQSEKDYVAKRIASHLTNEHTFPYCKSSIVENEQEEPVGSLLFELWLRHMAGRRGDPICSFAALCGSLLGCPSRHHCELLSKVAEAVVTADMAAAHFNPLAANF